jgi:hypothetical protein
MEYFILKPDGEQTGTFSLEQIRSMLNSGFIGADTRYWHEGISGWQPIDRIEESTNFPEPDSHKPQAPPPPSKWTGSLARAIPSPHHKRPSGPIPEVSGSAAPPSPAVPEPHRPVVEIPEPKLRIETPPTANGASTHDEPIIHEAPAISRGQAVAEAPRTPTRRRFRLPLPSFAHVRLASSILLAAAIIAAIVASRHPAKSALSQVTLTSRNDCVLTDQTAIKPFEEEMRNSPVIARLKDLIAKSTDTAFVQSASIGLQQEIAKHETDVTHEYVQNGKAEIVETGSYRTVAYLDDNGALVVAHAGAPWAAILYKGAIVYAYLGSDFQPRAQ